MINCRMSVPAHIREICKVLRENDFEAFVVGGAIRDILLGKECSDFDIATNAHPQDVLRIFPFSKAYGDFGTVMIITKGTKVEMTPYRDDAPGRKPQYSMEGTICTDLSRRDFTINSIAYDPISDDLLDPFRGMQDIKDGIIRCTGSQKRIWEDPLRAMRAARFQAQLGFIIDSATLYAIKAQASELMSISRERIRDELVKLITGDYCYDGLVTLVTTDLMKYIIPELMEGMGMMHRNKPMDVLEHNLIACKSIKNTPALRLAALLHDVAKPRVAKAGTDGLEFPKHHRESAFLAKDIMKGLRCNNSLIKKAVPLIRHHMFYSPWDAGLHDTRKLVSKVGWDNIYDLMEIRMADRIASGIKDPVGVCLRNLQKNLDILKEEKSDYRIKDLAVSGNDLVKHLKISPGPEVGRILNLLLEKTLINPELNNHRDLLSLAQGFSGS